MSELEEKLNALLSDPNSMAQVMQMAQQLSGAMGEQKAAAPPPPGTGEDDDSASNQSLFIFISIVHLLSE